MSKGKKTIVKSQFVAHSNFVLIVGITVGVFVVLSANAQIKNQSKSVKKSATTAHAIAIAKPPVIKFPFISQKLPVVKQNSIPTPKRLSVTTEITPPPKIITLINPPKITTLPKNSTAPLKWPTVTFPSKIITPAKNNSTETNKPFNLPINFPSIPPGLYENGESGVKLPE